MKISRGCFNKSRLVAFGHVLDAAIHLFAAYACPAGLLYQLLHLSSLFCLHCKSSEPLATPTL